MSSRPLTTPSACDRRDAIVRLLDARFDGLPEPRSVTLRTEPGFVHKTLAPAVCETCEGDDGFVKIGESTDPRRRLVDHQCGNPRKLRLLGSFAARSYVERDVQAQFAGDRVAGEWFTPTPELLAFIAERCA